MAKIFTLALVIVGIWMLLNIAGISTTGSYILGHWGNTPNDAANIEGLNIWVKITGYVALLIGFSVIVIGIFGKQINVIPFTAGIAAVILVVFITDMLAVIKLCSESYVQWILYAILWPLAIAYTIALWDWVRSIGSD